MIDYADLRPSERSTISREEWESWSPFAKALLIGVLRGETGGQVERNDGKHRREINGDDDLSRPLAWSSG